MKRKAGDLKLHVQDYHKSTYREAPTDCFGEPGCFYLSKYPRDYISVINPAAYGSPIGRFLRKAVEDWHPSVGEKASRTLRQWKEDWSSVPLLSQSPSPTLDYDEKTRPLQLKLHQLTVDSSKVKAMAYDELLTKLNWYKVFIDNTVRSSPKMMASILRRMDQVQPFEGVVPLTFGTQLGDDRFCLAQSRLSGVIKIDAKFINKILKEENISFAQVSEALEPAKMKQKTTQSSDSGVDQPSSTDPNFFWTYFYLWPRQKMMWWQKVLKSRTVHSQPKNNHRHFTASSLRPWKLMPLQLKPIKPLLLTTTSQMITSSDDHNHQEYEPATITEYQPTPKYQSITILVPPDLSTRAETLLRYGCMPMLPPGR